MYCPSCGNQIQTALNYCNRCGGKIEKSNPKEIQAKYQSISTAVGVVGLGGMIALVVLSLKLLKENVEIGALIVIVAMFLFAILAMIYMVIRFMPQYLESPKSGRIAETEYVAPGSLTAANTAQLEEPKQYPASVIEETTRTLDEVHINKN